VPFARVKKLHMLLVPLMGIADYENSSLAVIEINIDFWLDIPKLILAGKYESTIGLSLSDVLLANF